VDLARLLAVTVILQAMAMATSLATATVVAFVFPFGDRPLLRAVLAGTCAIAAAAAAAQQLQSRAIEHLRASFDREMLDQLMGHVLKLPIAFFDRFAPGEVLQRLRAFENVRLLLSTQGFAVLLNVGSLFVGGALMVALDAGLASVGVAIALLYAAAAWATFPSLRRAAADEVRARGRQQGRLLEVLQGLVTLRMSGDRDAAHQRWLPAFLEELAAGLRQDRLRAFARPALEWVRGAGLVGAVWMGAREVLAGGISLGVLVGFLGVLGAFVAAAAGLMAQVLSSAPSIVDYGLVRSTFLEPREQAFSGLLAAGRLRGGIVVDNVSFRYGDERDPLVLRDISLSIQPGMKVALVGASGSGKSTLGKLLLGLYLPTSGRILFDGKDVANLDLEALRRRMGVVLQEPFLLTGSIRENLSLGAEGVPFARIVEAAKRAAIHDDIEKMPMGYATLVSEGGTTFSGGQRQRCVIARALVSTPAVLLLDEATSALDNVSQALVERHLAHSTATRVVVAHRLSTVADSDLIVVMHRGTIVEKGTHEALLAARGPYYDLVRAQL
jgi:ABC-type bacteriocin/lantibiotic exporter with double-glycine peptidase domain